MGQTKKFGKINKHSNIVFSYLMTLPRFIFSTFGYADLINTTLRGLCFI